MKKLLNTLYVLTPDSYLFCRNENICVRIGDMEKLSVPGMDEAMTLRLTRQNGAWEGYLYDWAGQILATGVWDVEATKDFADITIAFATTFEINGNQRHAGFDRDNATFLSLGAPNRAYALRKYQELILKQK